MSGGLHERQILLTAQPNTLLINQDESFSWYYVHTKHFYYKWWLEVVYYSAYKNYAKYFTKSRPTELEHQATRYLLLALNPWIDFILLRHTYRFEGSDITVMTSVISALFILNRQLLKDWKHWKFCVPFFFQLKNLWNPLQLAYATMTAIQLACQCNHTHRGKLVANFSCTIRRRNTWSWFSNRREQVICWDVDGFIPYNSIEIISRIYEIISMSTRKVDWWNCFERIWYISSFSSQGIPTTNSPTKGTW